MYRVDSFFDREIRKFMYSGIEITLTTKTQYSCALLLSVYTEIMGGLVTGRLKEEHKSRENYTAFLPYLGKEYVELHKKIDLYKRIRSGLVHEFSPKKQYIIWLGDRTEDKPAFYYAEQADVINFHLREYYRDFKKGVDKYYEELMDASNSELLERFLKSTELIL